MTAFALREEADPSHFIASHQMPQHLSAFMSYDVWAKDPDPNDEPN